MASSQTRVNEEPHDETSARSTTAVPVRRRRKIFKFALVILVGVVVYAAYDLLAPRTSRMRAFDPDEIARLDTAMWRSYYAKEQFRLYNQLTELLRTQYNLPFIRSNAVAYQAARAAFVFKGGHNRQEYEKALPNLVSFYSSIRSVSDIPFDVERAARLELEWWIVHREREKHGPNDLTRALAELTSELYQIPTERFIEHARLRAEAMTIRDTQAEAGGVSEDDWLRIDELLHRSWRSLKLVVNN
jgi:hypothetical protein